jgi:hypothetical protein
MQALTRLIDDHYHLLALSDQLLGTVSEPIPDPEQAHEQLRTLASSIAKHVAAEEGVIELARKSGAYRMIPLQAQRGEAFQTLVCDWVHYLDSWPSDRVRAEWPSFSRETLVILRRVKEQISSENEAMHILRGMAQNEADAQGRKKAMATR